MMTILERLLGLESLKFGQQGVEFGFARELPAWGWFLVAVVAVGLAWWSYRRLDGARWWRVALGTVRALVLALIVVLLCGPRLLKPNESEEKDWVIVLADRSASMGVRDAPTAGVDRQTREDQLKSAISASRPMWNELAKDRVVSWFGFDAQARDLKSGTSDASTPTDLGPANGRRTALGASLEQALRRAAARPISGVVILSDGRSVDEPSRAVQRRLEAERIPVFTAPLGSAEPVADISVRRAEGPRNAFVNDFVPVEVELERIGPKSQGGAKPKVQLVEQATGAVLDEREIEFADGPTDEAGGARPQIVKLTLTTKAATPGALKWAARVVPGGPDLVTENNQAEVAIDMLDRPLRIAYFDGYPRWEYRYIKNLLVREKTFKASSQLLSAGRRFVQEGEEVMMTIPRSPEEWREYDVIMMGDLRPEMFTTEQLEQIKEHVALRGAGLIWIGGEGATPAAWRTTPLADLLPFVMSERSDSVRSSSDVGPPAWSDPVTMTPTPLAERLGVLRLATEPVNGSWWPRELADGIAGWSTLRWAQRIDPSTLKPTAEVLAEAHAPPATRPDVDSAAPSAPAPQPASAPIVLSMRFGAGRTLYVGTDEIWRWRYGRGELYPERFWVQMIRMLGRDSLSRSGKPASIEVTPRRAEVDQPVRISVTLLDQAVVDAAPASLRARVIREGDVGNRTPAEESAGVDLTLLPEGTGSSSRSGRAVSRTFATTWIATESGRFRVEVTDPLLAGLTVGQALTASAEVWLPEDEMRHPETDHALLKKLSDATGGKVLSASDLKDLPKLLPNRKLRLAGEPDIETLWDKPLALVLMVVLLTIEWVGRRLMKLA